MVQCQSVQNYIEAGGGEAGLKMATIKMLFI